MKKQFSANISTSGSSHVITIPAFLIHEGIINPKKRYRITMQQSLNNDRI